MAIPATRILTNTVLLLGEIHGVRENIQALEYFVREAGIQTVCIEVGSEYAFDFRSLRMSSYKSLESKIRKRAPEIFESGVLSQEHLQYYARLREQGIQVIPVKEEQKAWNSAEKRMAENIRTAVKTHAAPCAVTVGNYHARNKRFRLSGDAFLYTPLGWLLRDHSVSIQIRYAKGSAFNFHTIQLSDRTAHEKLEGKKHKLIPSHSWYFNYDMLLRKASPVVV